jgi:oligopeptide transport system substrate-binding protein
MMISRIQKTIICSVLSCGFLTFSAGAAPASPPFRFHIVAEPSTLSPVDSDNTEADYLFVNLYRGLFSYDNDIGVRPEGAKSCVRKTPIRIVCALNPSIKWNDGVPVKAEDYVRAFVALFRPGRPARDITLLSAVKNADAILKQKKMPSELGIHATGIYELTFDLIRPDGEFEEKLTAATLVPWREEPSRQNWKNNHYNGPYQIKDWVTDKKITLSPNPHYPNANSARPDVEVFVVADDTSALNLYESGELDLLRRLPSSLIPAYRSHEDFFQTPLDRFDYLGFGPELEDQRELRQALSLGADYDGFAIAFQTWLCGSFATLA